MTTRDAPWLAQHLALLVQLDPETPSTLHASCEAEVQASPTALHGVQHVTAAACMGAGCKCARRKKRVQRMQCRCKKGK